MASEPERDRVFALEMRRGNAAPSRAAFGVDTVDGAVLTWDSPTPTIGAYADLGVVDKLHGQDAPEGVRTHRHHLVQLPADDEDRVTGRMMLSRRLPILVRAAAAATAVLGAGPGPGSVFGLRRGLDVTGISGTGLVAYGLVLPDGAIVLTWDSPWPTITVYPSAAAVDVLHGHHGATHRVILDAPETRATATTLLSSRVPAATTTATAAAAALGQEVAG